MTALDNIKPFYYLPYGEAMICLDCRAIYPRSLDYCPAPGCGSRARELVARVHGDVQTEILGPPRKKEVQDGVS